jgi:hypothetical protein
MREYQVWNCEGLGVKFLGLLGRGGDFVNVFGGACCGLRFMLSTT